ncbi:MAG: aminodeoxychorismate/anthranilate synthase component II [Nannocystaceae bacterium]
MTPNPRARRRVIFVDNFDSFTFNLVDVFHRLGCDVQVFRNTVRAESVIELASDPASPALIVLSPGPGRPRDAGCCTRLVQLAQGKLWTLGICLGQQVMLEEAGGVIERADTIVHGKASSLCHDGAGAFAGLPSRIWVGRYHSLAARRAPARFRVHARIDDLVMAISDGVARQYGFQFHPESILTPCGEQILRNVLHLSTST